LFPPFSRLLRAEKIHIHGQTLVAKVAHGLAYYEEEVLIALRRFLREAFDEFEDHGLSILTTDFTDGTDGLGEGLAHNGCHALRLFVSFLCLL
jgi:hypothetical protein